MHSGQPWFYRATVSQMVVNLRAVQRQHGLEMMVGNAALARVFSPNEDVAQAASTTTILVCADCALTESLPLAVFLEGSA